MSAPRFEIDDYRQEWMADEEWRDLQTSRGIRFVSTTDPPPFQIAPWVDWLPEAREAYREFSAFLATRVSTLPGAIVASVDAKALPTEVRIIDVRPCDPLTDDDCNWPEPT